MLQIIEDLTPLNRVFCSSDYDDSIAYLQKHLPFHVVSFTRHDEINGWVIPPKWDLLDAKISKGGHVIYDATQHPLSVIALSKSFSGTVTLEELREHLYFDPKNPDAIPYHFKQMYRSWERDWGFCVTRKFYDSLVPGSYDVKIATQEAEGELKVLEYTLQGERPQEIAFVAHLDHPGMANDDLAGCAVGIELFKRLAERKRKNTYSLILPQEIIGSEYYLNHRREQKKTEIFESLFLEMLGTKTELALQESRNADSELEKSLAKAMRDLNIPYRQEPFRDIIGNDEIIWETHGIPMASLSRYPYPEYHTDKDNISIISEAALEESVRVLLKTVEYLESSKFVHKRFQGTLCTSNPRYDLYVDPDHPEDSHKHSGDLGKLRMLMDLIPTLQRPVTVSGLADKVGLCTEDAENYLQKWQDQGLIELR